MFLLTKQNVEHDTLKGSRMLVNTFEETTPLAIADGTIDSFDVEFPGVAADTTVATVLSTDADTQPVVTSAEVVAVDTVRVTIQNLTGSNIRVTKVVLQALVF